MTVYRIEERTETYDCWGRTEWDYWTPYNTKVYSSKKKAEEEMKVLGLVDSPCHEFRIKEIELVEDDD